MKFENFEQLIRHIYRNIMQDDYDRYLEIITSATELYVEQHRNRYVTLDKEGSSIYISISELISANMIDETLTNPKTSSTATKRAIGTIVKKILSL